MGVRKQTFKSNDAQMRLLKMGKDQASIHNKSHTECVTYKFSFVNVAVNFKIFSTIKPETLLGNVYHATRNFSLRQKGMRFHIVMTSNGKIRRKRELERNH